MLFNYDKCECCRKQTIILMWNYQNYYLQIYAIKKTENSINCDRCCLTYKREQSFLKVKDLHDYDKFYLQLTFLLKHSKAPQLFNWRCSKTHYNENMDKLFKDEDLIKRFGGDFENVKKI